MDYQKLVDEALARVGPCPYCDKKLKSASGVTLHRKVCGEIVLNKETKIKLGPVRYKFKEHQLVFMSEGLGVLDNGEIAPLSKLRDPEYKPEIIRQVSSKGYGTPETAKEWVQQFGRRNSDRFNQKQLNAYLKLLWSLTGYKYKWTDDEISSAINTAYGA